MLLAIPFSAVICGCTHGAGTKAVAIPADCSIPAESIPYRESALFKCGDDAPHPRSINGPLPELGAKGGHPQASAATVGCDAVAPTTAPSEAPRPADAAPLQYPANEGRLATTFTPPATIFGKLGVSTTTEPLRLKSCKLERWFQTSSAHFGNLSVIDPKRMVYEVITSFDHYTNRGGEWGPGSCSFIVDAATGNVIISSTSGHLIKSSLAHVERP